MAAKRLVYKQKSVEFVDSAAKTHRDRIADKVAEEFPGRDPVKMRDALLVVVDSIAFTTKNNFESYEAAETALAVERGDDAGIAAERNEAAEGVVSLLVDIRKAAANTDPALPATLGFKGDTPREPGAVIATGKYVVAQLKKLAPVPSTVMRGFVFNPALYQDLKPAVARLEKAQATWIADGRENDAAMVDRNRAEDKSDRSLSLSSTILGALLKAAGEELLAARVGAPGRRKGTIAEFDPEFVEEAQPEPITA